MCCSLLRVCQKLQRHRKQNQLQWTSWQWPRTHVMPDTWKWFKWWVINNTCLYTTMGGKTSWHFLYLNTLFLFLFLLQGVPVQAIRNKMVMEGLDPNLLEWVFFFLLLLFCFYPNTSAFLLFISNWPIIIPSLLIIAHQMPLCLMEKLGAQRTKMLMLTVLTVNLLSVTDISTLLSSP